MKLKLMRLLRGEWPNRTETWAEYMDRKIDLPLAIGLCFAVVGVMVVLAEAIDQGIK